MSDSMTTLTALLARLRDAAPEIGCYRGPADFVLRHGAAMAPGAWRRFWREGAPRLCFGNSIIRAAEQEWRYVEGFALQPHADVPILHGWNITEAGELVDCTWQNRGRAYLGVEFSLGRADYASWFGDGSVLQASGSDWAIFRQLWKGEDFAREWPQSPPLAALYRHLQGVRA